MRVITTGLAAAALVLSIPAARAQDQDFSKVEITSQKLADGVYVLFGQGGNIGVSAGKDGVFIVDDQYAPLTAKIRAAIERLSDKPVRFVLNTHWHGDHTGGNENMAGAGAVIVAHENVRKRMSVEQFNEIFNRKTPPSAEAALPVVTYAEAVTFHLNGDDVDCFHVPPAHTDTDSIVVFKKANVVHMGDTFFNGFYPFIDVSTGGSLEGVLAAAERVLALANDTTQIIPGHGPVGKKADLKAYRDMLATVRDRVRPLVAAGKSLAEVQAAKPLASLDETWGKGFMKPEQFLTVAYLALGGTKK
jgi:cyclase